MELEERRPSKNISTSAAVVPFDLFLHHSHCIHQWIPNELESKKIIHDRVGPSNNFLVK